MLEIINGNPNQISLITLGYTYIQTFINTYNPLIFRLFSIIGLIFRYSGPKTHENMKKINTDIFSDNIDNKRADHEVIMKVKKEAQKYQHFTDDKV